MKNFIKGIGDFFTILLLLILLPLILHDLDKQEKEWQKKYDAASDEEKEWMLIEATSSHDF